MTADLSAKHHVRIGTRLFCTEEWIERPDHNHNAAVIRCPHTSGPLRSVRVRPTFWSSLYAPPRQ